MEIIIYLGAAFLCAALLQSFLCFKTKAKLLRHLTLVFVLPALLLTVWALNREPGFFPGFNGLLALFYGGIGLCILLGYGAGWGIFGVWKLYRLIWLRNVIISVIKPQEMADALNVIWNTFLAYEAPDYTAEGVETFKKSVIDNEDYLNSIVMYGACRSDTLLGIIATRNQGSHIALFFVEGKYHRRGIGKKLFQKAVASCPSNAITVHSSPYASEIYHQLGFTDTAKEQVSDGIRYIPMKCIRRE